MKRFLILVVLILIIGSVAGGYFAVAQGVPAIAELKKYRNLEGTKVYADDNTLIGEFKIDKGIYVPYGGVRCQVLTIDSTFLTSSANSLLFAKSIIRTVALAQ